MSNDAPQEFQLTLISNDLQWVAAAEAAGLEQIGIDIERLGKSLRQKSVPEARISNHELSDLAMLSGHVRRARLFVRLNPPHPGTRHEVETALALGATSLMLPYFHTVAQAAQFVSMVAKRARVILLVETCDALQAVGELVKIDGVDEIMLGLNDLHLELKFTHPVEVAASDLVAQTSHTVRQAGLTFGFGGVGRPDDLLLPIDPDLVLARYAQVGASAAWISRSFLHGMQPSDFDMEIKKLRARLAYWFAKSPSDLSAAHQKLKSGLRRVFGHAP